MNISVLLLGIVIGAAVGGLVVWLASLTHVARDAFASLSAEALRQNNQSFLALAQTKLGEFQQSASSDLEKRQKAVDDLVRPIQEALVRVDGKLQQVEKDRISTHSGLMEQVKAMAQTQQAFRRRLETWSRRCGRRRCEAGGVSSSFGEWSSWRVCSTTATSWSR